MKKRPNAWIREKEYIIKLYEESIDLEDMDMAVIILQSLYNFITGKDIWQFLGRGINTYPLGDRNELEKHDACLELERLGLIYRKKEYMRGGQLTSILWMPKDGKSEAEA